MATFPLSVHPSGRYLVDSVGVPFLIVGDSPQGLMRMSVANMTTYMANRSAKGFNAIQVHLLCGPNFGGTSTGATVDGITPFTTNGDFSTPREAYFARVDAMLTLAASYGIVVFLTVIETIDWLSTTLANSTANCTGFGTYIGTRYRTGSFPNIVWNWGNDFQSYGTDSAKVLAVCDAVQTSDTTHIHTAWLNYFISSVRDSASWNTRCALDGSYSYAPTYGETLQEYALSPKKPVHFIEGNYEGESLRGFLTTPLHIRKQAYWAMTGGACGQFACNADIWPFLSGWASRLDASPGMNQMTYLKSLFSAIHWWLLIPDTNTSHATMTAGYGTYNNDDITAVNTNTYATCSRASDGSAIVAYLPTSRQVTIDMTKITGATATCRWFNPSTGAYTAIGEYATTGTRNFTPASGDWVLLLTGTGSVATYVVTNPTVSNVQAACNSATQPGSVVWINYNGTIDWATPVTWSAPPNAILRGNGSLSVRGGNDITVINSTSSSGVPILDITTNDSGTFTMQGLGFTNGGAVVYNGVVSINGNSASVIVDHCHWNQVNAVALQLYGAVLGVAYECRWDFPANSTNNGIRAYQGQLNGDSNGWGDGSHSMPLGMGSANAFYVEDSTFAAPASTGQVKPFANDMMNGGRLVLRFCSLSQVQLQTHGIETPVRRRGPVLWEFYKNIWTMPSIINDSVNEGFYLEGGTGMIWGNTLTGYFLSLVGGLYHRESQSGSTPSTWGGVGSLWDGGGTSGYPCLDQVGRGAGDRLVNDFSSISNQELGYPAWPRQVSAPAYEWSNGWVAVPTWVRGKWVHSHGQCQENRDYYLEAGSFNGSAGVGVKTKAQMNAISSPTAGVGCWVTDEGSWNKSGSGGQGVFYIADASRVWQPYYTPYTYPHPLREVSQGASPPIGVPVLSVR
jgi:hypothetical protein